MQDGKRSIVLFYRLTSLAFCLTEAIFSNIVAMLLISPGYSDEVPTEDKFLTCSVISTTLLVFTSF